ncbi:MAG: endonuclease [Clostridiales bacterium]|nr:endonuclease [Clostridiales bacterium]
MKRFLNTIAMCLAAMLLFCSVAGCASDRVPTTTKPRIATPEVTIGSDGVASWERVDNALYYIYVIDGGNENLTIDLSVQLSNDESITVKAVSGSEDYDDSDFSAYKTYTENTVQQPGKLSTPQVTIASNGVASWSSVDNAQYYFYIIDNGTETKTTERSVTLTNNQTIKVKACSDDEEYTDSDYSQIKTYIVGAPQPTKLGTPQVNISTNGVATWGSIANAQYYYYVINSGAETKITGRSVTLESNQSIKVKACSDDANYENSDYSQAKTYIKSSTIISPEVQKYYSGITATSGNELLGQIHDLITTTHTYYTSYDDCKNTKYIYLTDPGPNGGALEFYTQNSIMSFSGNPGTWNREHVWCKSLSNGMWTDVSGGTRNGGTDLHHIRPAEGVLNSTRGSYKFGVANGGKEAWSKDTSRNNVAVGGHISGSTFEPLDKVKGDVARIVFYVYTHYNTYANVYGTTNGSGGAFGTLKFNNIVSLAEPAAIKLMLEWNAADPVDQIEITRNNEVYKIQGNRNPFIDHPEYASAIWG